ncbi:MAG: outer membrane beta-barrel protein [Saprospiraceae bacterium]|nr:outer membrane beta-barrel protein [Saprospiraceae bacterium]
MRFIYVHLLLAISTLAAAQSLRHPTLKLSLIQSRYNTKNSERTERFGTGTVTTTGIYNLKTLGFQLGAEYSLTERLSAALDFQSTFLKQETLGETGYRSNGVSFHGTYPREISLKTFSLQPKIYYNFLSDFRKGIKLGIGPTLLHSRLHRLTYMAGDFDADGNFQVQELGWTQRNANGVGVSANLLFDYNFTPFWRVFLSGQFDFYGDDWMGTWAIGLGYSI